MNPEHLSPKKKRSGDNASFFIRLTIGIIAFLALMLTLYAYITPLNASHPDRSSDSDQLRRIENAEILPSKNIELWYDIHTGIVYFWNDTRSANRPDSPTPYYASNGLPYRYDPTTGMLEEILAETSSSGQNTLKNE